MLPCIISKVSENNEMIANFIEGGILLTGIITLFLMLRRDHRREMAKKADKDFVDKLEKELKEEIKCIEETQIRENKELKTDYQTAISEVKDMLSKIYDAVLSGKITINK
jgi:hypothetical protein